MREFHHRQDALRVFSGVECLWQLQPELRRLGCRRAMIVSTASVARQGHVARLAGILGDLHAGSFVAVKAHSPLPSVMAAVDALREAGADAIVVAGGGSAVITARAASALLAEGRPLDEVCSRRLPDGRFFSPRLIKPMLPLLVAPTTPNSAYVKAGAGVFDPVAAERKAIFAPQTRARAIFLCPDLLMSAPRDLVVSASLDNLVLAAEGLLSPEGNPLADAGLIHALTLMHRALWRWAGGEDGGDLRLDLALAGILAGQGTDPAPAGACTALGHAIGAGFDCDNARTKAVLWPHVLAFDGAYATAGLAKLARALDLPGAGPAEVIARFVRLFRALDLPAGLDAFGIGRDDLPAIAVRAMKDWFMSRNCRPVRQADDLLPVLAAALTS